MFGVIVLWSIARVGLFWLGLFSGGKVAETALTRMRRIYSDPYGPQSLLGTKLQFFEP